MDLCHGIVRGDNHLEEYLNSLAIVSSQFSDEYKSVISKVLHQRHLKESVSSQNHQIFQMFMSAILSHLTFANDKLTRTTQLRQEIKASAVAMQSTFSAKFMLGLHEAATKVHSNDSITPQEHHHMTLYKTFVNAYRVQHYGHTECYENLSQNTKTTSFIESNELSPADNALPDVSS